MDNLINMKAWILVALATAGSAAAQALGGWDTALKVLVAFMIADYVTGLMVAAIWHSSRKTPDGSLDSRAGAKGLARKMLILLFVGLGAMLDQLTSSDFFRDAVCLFYVGNEGLSILENTAIMGVPYPQMIKDALEILKKKGDQGPDQEDETEEQK